eukprot:TRINITY_DN15014_c0_g1_i1.p1 TRINITY_DN15014_c0_g1~~TRINITY_DN15014_c0_g1_i1.p1  ORF type:complete len:199 (-),score=24.71 TRINITY_DN15014_c0_g1_i1:60-656(-)
MSPIPIRNLSRGDLMSRPVCENNIFDIFARDKHNTTQHTTTTNSQKCQKNIVFEENIMQASDDPNAEQFMIPMPRDPTNSSQTRSMQSRNERSRSMQDGAISEENFGFDAMKEGTLQEMEFSKSTMFIEDEEEVLMDGIAAGENDDEDDVKEVEGHMGLSTIVGRYEECLNKHRLFYKTDFVRYYPMKYFKQLSLIHI